MSDNRDNKNKDFRSPDSEKLEAIIRENDIRDITIVRMEVPCCGGLEYAARQALQRSGKFIPWRVVTIGVDGRIVED
jgi:hypothetical protein